ncbi:MAG: tetratricopeptide repeat protein [Planctomycetia bacterium]|nr:tetratricopeptide repeat protein [Planctomycetia bacterium]
MKANLPPSQPNPSPEQNPDSPLPVVTPPTTVNPRSRRRVWILVSVAVLVLGGIGAWWWIRNSDRPPDPPLPPAIADEEVKQAIEKARAKVLASPRSADDWGAYALVLLVHDFEREAETCLVEAARLNPSDPRWPYARSLIARKRDPDNAPKYLRQAIDTNGNPRYVSAARFALAEVLLERQEIDSAEQLFRQELGPDPGHPRAVLGLAQVAMARGDEPTATKLLMSVRENVHARKQATALLAVLARTRGDEQSALRFQDESNNTRAEGWPDPLLDRIHDLHVGKAGRERRIEMFERQGQYAEALREYRELLAKEQTPKVLTGAALNSLRVGNHDEALRWVRQAVKLDPNDAQRQYLLALILYSKVEMQWARTPGFAGAKESLEEVIGATKRATELKPDHAGAYWIWGLALKYLDDPKAALEPLRKGLTISPDDFELHLTLGQVLASTGDKPGAEVSFENARKIDPNDPRPGQELDKLRQK